VAEPNHPSDGSPHDGVAIVFGNAEIDTGTRPDAYPPAGAIDGEVGQPPHRRRGIYVAMVAVAVVAVVAALRLTGGDGEQAAPTPSTTLPPPTMTPRAPQSPPGLGVYRGSNPDEVERYEDWIGTEIPYVLEFWGRDDDWGKIDDPRWVIDLWIPTGRTVVYSIAMLPNDRFTLEDGAAGAYDAHWRRFAEAFAERGETDAILRIGWEFNGDFYPWAAGGKEDLFVDYWRRIVDVLRSVPGTNFQFDWSPLGGNRGADVERAYPGDEYVDFIGLDAYDNSPVNTSPEDRWLDIRDREYGLAWHSDFATTHGKRMTFPEWGLTVREQDSLGGGDNPYYIEQMHDWIHSHDVAYAMYFEYDARDASHRLMTTDLPEGGEAFLRLFGDRS
jgi:hypothetical protein